MNCNILIPMIDGILNEKIYNSICLSSLSLPKEKLNACLIYVIRHKNYKVSLIKNILDAGADVDCRCKSFGYTPLLIATWNNKLDIIEILLEYKANVKLTRSAMDNMTPTSLAISHDKKDAIKMFLKYLSCEEFYESL